MTKKTTTLKGISLLLILVMILAACQPTETIDENEADQTNDPVQEETKEDTVEDTKEEEQAEEEPTEPEIDPDQEQARFDAFLDEMATKALEESPLTASFTLGDLEEAGLIELAADLDRLDLDMLQDQIDEAIMKYEELLTINKDVLTDEQKVNYEMAKFNLSFAEGQGNFMYMDHLIQPSSGVQVNFPLALMQIEFESRAELDAFVERVKKVPRLFDEVIVYEQARFDMGYGLPGSHYEDVIEQIDAMVGEPEEFMMYLSFVDRVDNFEGLTDEERAAYKDDYLAVIADGILPAMVRLKEQAMAMVSSTNSGSISEVDYGKAYYESVVKYKTANELDVPGLEAWTGEQMAAVIGRFQNLLTRNPDILEVDLMAMLPEFGSMEEIYALVDQAYTENFLDYGVESASENVIPPYLEEHLAAGFYFPLTIDGEDYGNMFLRKEDYETQTIDTAVLMYHENIPGHHLYYSYVAGSDQPIYRKMNEFLTYEEGWATYIQNLSFDYMEMDPDIVEFLELNSAYSNAFMVLLDIQFHYHGMTQAQAKEQLLGLGYDEETADSVLTRMISKPGEMIHYMYGEFKMQELKAMYEEAAGDSYSSKDFHNFILMHYGLPFYVVEEELGKLEF